MTNAFPSTALIVVAAEADLYEKQKEVDNMMATLWFWSLIALLFVVMLNLTLGVLVNAAAASHAEDIESLTLAQQTRMTLAHYTSKAFTKILSRSGDDISRSRSAEVMRSGASLRSETAEILRSEGSSSLPSKSDEAVEQVDLEAAQDEIVDLEAAQDEIVDVEASPDNIVDVEAAPDDIGACASCSQDPLDDSGSHTVPDDDHDMIMRS
eukprot:TRINITY_DN11334_c0_g1_i1.p1 TRINITY_DN11334_c0_g1~~TRINITY_DN11334_c0_g1_i1.p1  ORF type:complete len:238 (-),score=59.06 TRINITY_DN11334_c0_g1_i1:545-1174(-)